MIAEAESAAPAALVSEKLGGAATPVIEVVTEYEPATVFAVAVTLQRPFATVAQLAAERLALAPEPGAVKFTVADGTTLPNESCTSTSRAVPNAVATVALWPSPETIVAVAAPAGSFVSAKLGGVATPVTLVVTVYAPVTAFAVAVTLQRPFAAVAQLAAERLALAPLPGAV